MSLKLQQSKYLIAHRGHFRNDKNISHLGYFKIRFVPFALLFNKLTGRENKILHCCEESKQEDLTIVFIPNGLRTFVARKEAQTISNY